MLGVSKHIDECAVGLTPQFTIFPFYKILSSSDSLLQTFLGLSHVPPHERLLNGQATSVHWWLAFVSKETIRCSVSVDISVVCQAVCHVLMHCLGSSILHDGQMVENKNFSVKCCLLAFNIVALGPVVSLELFVRRAVLSLLAPHN